MLKFKKIELEDRDWIEERLKASDFKSCEYAFANNFIWGEANEIEFADVNGFYCMKSRWENKEIYTFPAGKGDIKPVIEALMEDAKERGIQFQLRGMVKEAVEAMEAAFPGQYEYVMNRDECDYLYTYEKLSTLAGKKLHGKRNHINRFMDNPDWQYEDITPENIGECKQMSKEWCKLYSCKDDPDLRHEYCAVRTAFKHFFELKLDGGFIRKEGKIIAFTMGEPLSSDTYVVHIEKAFPEVQGAYPMINQQFVIHHGEGFQYINREEDLGEEGLRKAKLSYYPDILLEKYSLKLK